MSLIAEMQRIQEKAHVMSESIHERTESLLHPEQRCESKPE